MSTAPITIKHLVSSTSASVTTDVSDRTLVLPIGSIEQHGPHLPLSVDTLLAESFGAAMAAEVDGYLLPSLPIGVRSLPQSGGGLSFPGTVYMRGETFTRVLVETLTSLARLPFSRLIISNGHYENESFIFEALDELRDQGVLNGRDLIAFSWWSLVQDDWISANIPDFPGWHAEHAGLTETSLMLALHPALVRSPRPDNANPPPSGIYRYPTDPRAVSTQGVLSRTSMASASLGHALYNHVLQQFSAYLSDRSLDRT